MFRQNFNTFIDAWGGFLSITKIQAETKLLKCALRFFIGSPQPHLAASFASWQTWTETRGAREKISPSKGPTVNIFSKTKIKHI